MRPRLYVMIALSIPVTLIGMNLLANCGGGGGSASGGGASLGGSGGTGGGACTPTPGVALQCGLDGGGTDPANPLLTDFSADGGMPQWNVQSGMWGTTGNLTGSIFTYRGPNTSTTAWPAATVTNGALTNMGMIASGDYGGMGISFGQCVNAPNYTGVSFMVSGNTGGCTFQFQVQTLDEQETQNGGLCNQCNATCYLFPKTSLNLTLSSTPQLVTIPFSELANSGMPAAVADFTQQMIGFQWHLQAGSSGACNGVSLAVTDVSFTTGESNPDAGGGTGGSDAGSSTGGDAGDGG